MMARPSVCRLVHYVQGDRCLAAIITDVGDWPDGTSEADKANIAVPVSLEVFYPPGTSWADPRPIAVWQSEEGHEPGTWHWPERV
jgi:hypothetical protein